MGREGQIKKLRTDVKAWNHWRRENSGVHIDLSNADLSSATLSNANLSNATLSNANLSHANLIGANLYDADLTSANLSNATLSNATLHGANLNSATLTYATLTYANLTGANLTGADLTSAALLSANLSNATLSNATLRDAQLYKTIFGDADLSQALGLVEINHRGHSIIDHRTLEKSWPLPTVFLRGVGLPENLIDYLPSLMNQAIEFYSCFISYNHTDKVFARRLHAQLQDRGIRCWLDEHQMLPGDDIYEKIQHGIKLWDKVLLCCSENSLTSWWVDNEIDSAFKKERQLMKDRGKKVMALIPLDTDGYLFSGQWQSGKEEQVTSRIAANFQGWEKDNDLFEREFEKVVKALRSDDGVREIPPVPRL